MFRNSFRYILIIILGLLCFSSALGKNAETKKFTVVIDAGHGGKDVGATDNGVMEKNINLKVARELESLIKKKMKDTRVEMTRSNDTYLTLQQRADVANKAQADLFISIHTNSVDKKNRNRKTLAGSSVYTLGLHKDDNNLEVAMRENSVIELENDYQQKYSGFDPQRDESYIIFEMAQKKNLSQSIHFAESVQKELVNAGRQERGVHQAGFWVLWATSMPSVLIELDFICNPESAKYMSSDKGAKELAEAIFKALQKYEQTWRKSINGSLVDNSLPNTYSSDEPSRLSDSYPVITESAVARTRTREHKTPQVNIASNSINKNNGKRRRRSNSAKAKSDRTDYEDPNLRIVTQNYTVSDADTQEEIITLAAVDTSGKNSSKKKKENSGKKVKEEKKKEAKPKKNSRKDDAHNAKVNKLVTVYKIQILASEELLRKGNSRFCGLSPITAYKENNLYKYYYGESTDKREIEAMLADVRKKIPDAFIVSSKKSVQKN